MVKIIRPPTTADMERAQNIRRAMAHAGLRLEKTENNNYNEGLTPTLSLSLTLRAVEEDDSLSSPEATSLRKLIRDKARELGNAYEKHDNGEGLETVAFKRDIQKLVIDLIELSNKVPDIEIH